MGADKVFSLGEFLLADIPAAALVQFVKSLIDKGVKEPTEKSFAESRGELFGFIMTLPDETAANNFRRRQLDRQFGKPRSYGSKTPYGPADEVKFVQLLTKLYAALGETSEKETRKRVFVKLGRMEDEDFDGTLTFLEHDIVVQWLRRLGVVIENSYEWLKAHAGPLVEDIKKKIPPVIERLRNLPAAADTEAARQINDFACWLDEKTQVPGVTVRGHHISSGALVGLGIFLSTILYFVLWAIFAR